ncbi:MAG: hypothetical protein KI790_07705 [Cyclobacteriaceae bacterium]|nr:hypothetical protein [Cyclobacteriaceae bacterium HetDA_MAG_MS6]
MDKKLSLAFAMSLTCISLSFAQQDARLDSLRQDILNLRLEVNQISLNLSNSKSRFQSGILVSTIGYSVTIAGGLMLGRENDGLGQSLLIAGGVTGVTGTYLMVDAFRALTGRKKKKRKVP